VLAGLAAALAAFGAPSAFGSTQPGTLPDSGLAACAYSLTARHVTAAEYRQIRAQFAGSRRPDLRPSGSTSGWPPPAPKNRTQAAGNEPFSAGTRA
jgi:hypothetical protein